MIRKKTDDGQTIIEYSLVLGIIIMVMVAMQPMIKRVGQGMIKLTADQIGNQQAADQRAFYPNSTSQSHMQFALTSSDVVVDTQTVEFLRMTNYVHNDATRIGTSQQSNLGFTNSRTP